MYARPQERTRKNLHMPTKLACEENVCLILQAQLLGMIFGGSEITNALRNTKECATGTNLSLEASQES